MNEMQSVNFILDDSMPFQEVLIYEITLIPFQFQLMCKDCGYLVDYRYPCFHQKDHPLVVSHDKAKKSEMELEMFGKAWNQIKKQLPSY